IVLAGPDGLQKEAQAEFLARRYGLKTIAADDLARRSANRFLLKDCAVSERETRCISELARGRDIRRPVFIEVADRSLGGSPWDVYTIQAYYPEADVWTLDGTRPTAAISETLQRLLDRETVR